MTISQLTEYGIEQMEDDEIREFLSTQSVGVLGLPTDGVPYMLPLSYAHTDESLYFTYLLGESSRKETLTERTSQAGFLVYSVETMFNWQSVLLTGDVSAVPEDEWEDLRNVLSDAWRPNLLQTATTSGGVRVYEFEIVEQTGIRQTGLAPGFRETVDYQTGGADDE